MRGKRKSGGSRITHAYQRELTSFSEGTVCEGGWGEVWGGPVPALWGSRRRGLSSPSPVLQHWGWGNMGCRIHSPIPALELSQGASEEQSPVPAEPGRQKNCFSDVLALLPEVTFQNPRPFGFTWTLKE